MAGDRHGVVARDERAGEVHRKRRSGHIGDGHIGHGRNHVDKARAAEHRGRTRHEPGRREHREVVQHHGLELVHGRLRLHRRGMDGLEPLDRVLDVGREADQDHAGLVVGGLVAGFAQAHRHAGHQRLGGQFIVVLEITAQRTRHRAHDHVVQRHAEVLGDRLGFGQRDRAAGKAALIGDRHVERRARCEQTELLGGRLQVFFGDLFIRARDIADGARDGRRHLEQLDVLLCGVAQRGAGEFGDAQLIAAAARAWTRRPHGAALRAQVENRLAERHAGLPVDAGVMHLGVEGDLTALQPVDDEELPQRSAAIEQRGMHARHILLQLAVGTRPGQRDVAHVVVDVHVVVVHPHRVREVERHQGELAREDVGQMDPAGHEGLGIFVEIALVALGQVQHVERTHVHWHFRGFHVQERGVEAAQMVHLLSPFLFR